MMKMILVVIVTRIYLFCTYETVLSIINECVHFLDIIMEEVLIKNKCKS